MSSLPKKGVKYSRCSTGCFVTVFNLFIFTASVFLFYKSRSNHEEDNIPAPQTSHQTTFTSGTEPSTIISSILLGDSAKPILASSSYIYFKQFKSTTMRRSSVVQHRNANIQLLPIRSTY